MNWYLSKLPGNRDWPRKPDKLSTPRWVEPIAWDTLGNLYALWSEGKALFIGSSADNGISWSTYKIATDEERIFFPYLTSSSNGQLACTWFTGFGERLSLHAAQITWSSEEPTLSETVPIQLDIWLKREEHIRWTGGEYIPIKFLQNGNLGMVTPIYHVDAQRFGFTCWELENALK